MIDHLLTNLSVPVWVLLIWGLFTGIGWSTLALEIYPVRLLTYFRSLFSAVIEYWFKRQKVL